MSLSYVKASQNWLKSTKRGQKFCKWIDLKVLNWEESWIENDEKGRKGDQKRLKSSWQMSKMDKRDPNCLKRDKVDLKGVKSW